ncbi:MAG: hypothetical protein SFX72_20835 [Isosphaeraceae bacterium]|nr:hypothetical protein [Isosphaeraceae bacterium]
MRRGTIALLIGTPVLLGSLACGEDPDALDRRPVTGRVSLDGRPLEFGHLLLEPGVDGPGTAVGAAVESGSFAIPRAQGPVPGRYRVRIYASSGEMQAGPPGSSSRKPRPMIERIPARYNADTTLEVEIASDRENRLDFALQSDPAGGSPP